MAKRALNKVKRNFGHLAAVLCLCGDTSGVNVSESQLLRDGDVGHTFIFAPTYRSVEESWFQNSIFYNIC